MRVVVGVLVAPIAGPPPHHKPKPRLVDPWLEYERKRKALERAYGLPVEPEGKLESSRSWQACDCPGPELFGADGKLIDYTITH